MLIDTHSHLNFKAFDGDLDQVIDRCVKENIGVVNIGTKYETSKKAIEIAEKHNGFFASIGLHPIHIRTEVFKIKMDENEGAFEPRGEDLDIDKYRELAKSSDKVVAVGEIGLDFYYKPKTKTRIEQFKNIQKEVFVKQLELARELNLPAIIHCRMAHKEMIEILSGYSVPGVIHCFTGSWEEAEKYLKLGFYLGINGIMYKLDLKEVIEKTPLNRILLETDCPYLGPNKGDRNEPVFVKQIAKDIARIKNISFEEVAQVTTQNAQTLFII